MDKDLQNLLAQLQQDNALKVWSLIVTFFGDAIVFRGGNVSAKTVQSVLTSMGVSEGAVRTALSRLASDHWIDRQKVGRESFYELAKDGQETFEKATARIYAPVSATANKEADSWTLSLSQPGAGGAEAPPGGIQITSGCWLSFNATTHTTAAKDKLVLSGQLENVPHWVTDAIIPEALQLRYKTLIHRFSSIDAIDKLSPQSCLVLRCLLIHEWRRLLLRTPVVPSTLQTPDWPEQPCRQFVAMLYHKLVRKSEEWLNEHATCIHGALPTASQDIHSRFTHDFTLN